MAFSMIATRDKTRESVSEISCRLSHELSDDLSRIDDPALESLRKDSPALMALPLLQAVAENTEKQVRLPYSASSMLYLELQPC